MRIEIINWAKYNPRSDVKNTTWFRMENSFWLDPVLSSLGNNGRMTWILLLAFASKQQSGSFILDTKLFGSALQIKTKTLSKHLSFFHASGMIRIYADEAPSTLRERDATERDVTERNENPPKSPPSGGTKNRGHKIDLRGLRTKACLAATKAIGTLRSGVSATEAQETLGKAAWLLLQSKFGSWEGFARAYGSSTIRKHSGGSDATIFEAQLVKSFLALLEEAPSRYLEAI